MTFTFIAFDVGRRAVMELADTLGDEHGCQVTIAHSFDCRIEQFVLIDQSSCLLADYTLAGKLGVEFNEKL